MNRYYQVPHHAIGWLLLAALWTVLPAMLRGPLSIMVVVLLLLGWRWQIYRARLSMPSAFLRIAILLLLILLTLWHFHTIFGPAAGVSLLSATFALKLLEMLRKRDVFVVLLLGYFVLAMVFLFHKGPFITLYVAVGFVLLTAAMTGVNQTRGQALPHLKKAVIMVLQALPLMLIFFVVVPRVAPLWGFSFDNDQAKTGLSGSMAPGSISDVSQSSDPVFRVTFKGAIPPPKERYWRGLTYSWYDGKTWRQAVARGLSKKTVIHYPGDPSARWYRQIRQEAAGKSPDYQYQVMMEPSGRRWLFSLGVPFTRQPDIGLARDFRLVSRKSIKKTMAYQVKSYTHLHRDVTLPYWLRELNLALPAKVDPRTRRLAQKWYGESGSDKAFIRRILAWFHNQPFYYTLHPPKLQGRNRIDAFLFESRKGFCAHYASAFAFMMRSVGIPARIVAGYQGGELNPLGDYLQVRQYDAHAWVEVWLKGKGWVREDPTAAVAPARITDGLVEVLRDQGDEKGASSLSWKATGVLKRITLLSDYVNYVWQRWVLDYDRKSQGALFDSWFGKGRWLYWLLGGVAIVLLLVASVLWWLAREENRRLPPWQQEYLKLYRAMKKRGVKVSPRLSPKQLIALAGYHWPAKRSDFQAWLTSYHQLAYAPQQESGKNVTIRELKRQYPL